MIRLTWQVFVNGFPVLVSRGVAFQSYLLFTDSAGEIAFATVLHINLMPRNHLM